MKTTSTMIALGVGAAFGATLNLAPYQHLKGELHVPPGNAPITLTGLATANGTVTMHSALVLCNSIHDAEYQLPADTTPLKSDGQLEKA